MRKYKDTFGHTYEVPDEYAAQFERRRTVMLRAAIGIKLLILGAMIYFLA